MCFIQRTTNWTSSLLAGKEAAKGCYGEDPQSHEQGLTVSVSPYENNGASHEATKHQVHREVLFTHCTINMYNLLLQEPLWMLKVYRGSKTTGTDE